MIETSGSIGVVVIGRNEGQRLVTCLHSLLKTTSAIVYVDSGSTDNSVSVATALGVHVVNLDMQRPFTAARARNAGYAALLQMFPDTAYVQFVDGDCEVVPTWLARAAAFLMANPDVAIVCGRRRERFPEASIYNYQCDLEWNTPIGTAKACGGDFLCRSAVFSLVSGFNPHLIAGEEPELCIRIRQQGWKIERIDEEMTLHDANILHFKQFWKRSVRAGHAFAEGASLYGGAPEFHWVKETRRALIWGGILPFLLLISLVICPAIAMALMALYALQLLRLKRMLQHTKASWHLACLLLVSKMAECMGAFTFYKNNVLHKQGKLIEYK